MDVQKTKEELVELILNIENEQFLREVTDFIRNEKADFWNELNEAERKEIKKGIEDLDKGKRISYQDFLKKIS